MFMDSVKRECEICGCDKNEHSENKCSSCDSTRNKNNPQSHEYADSPATLERMSQYNLHLMYRSYGGFWL